MIDQLGGPPSFTKERPRTKLDKVEACCAGAGQQEIPPSRLFAALLSLPMDRYRH
jgi:hypothetical protein